MLRRDLRAASRWQLCNRRVLYREAYADIAGANETCQWSGKGLNPQPRRCEAVTSDSRKAAKSLSLRRILSHSGRLARPLRRLRENTAGKFRSMPCDLSRPSLPIPTWSRSSRPSSRRPPGGPPGGPEPDGGRDVGAGDQLPESATASDAEDRTSARSRSAWSVLAQFSLAERRPRVPVTWLPTTQLGTVLAPLPRLTCGVAPFLPLTPPFRPGIPTSPNLPYGIIAALPGRDVFAGMNFHRDALFSPGFAVPSKPRRVWSEPRSTGLATAGRATRADPGRGPSPTVLPVPGCVCRQLRRLPAVRRRGVRPAGMVDEGGLRPRAGA